MIILFQRSCEGCTGNAATAKMKQACLTYRQEFDVRTTLLWEGWAKDAEKLEERFGIKQPFFYNTETGKALEANTFTLLEQMERFVNEKK